MNILYLISIYGAEAIHAVLGGHNISVVNNSFENIAGTAISIAQTNLFYSNETWFKEIHPKNKSKIFENVEIKNNYLYKICFSNLRQGPAISCLEFITGFKVIHNEIDNTSSLAIRSTWRYGGFFWWACWQL